MATAAADPRWRSAAVVTLLTGAPDTDNGRVPVVTSRARWSLALGALTALLVTVPFALSYFSAYGSPEELPPPWLAALEDPLARAGAIVPGSTTVYDVYDVYGVIYLVAWVAGLSGLAAGLRTARPSLPDRLRRAWNLLLGSLALVGVGILGDYAVPHDLVGFVGFVLTCLGFVASALILPWLGLALRRDGVATLVTSLLVGALGAASVVGGTAVLGHTPSGPGLGFALAALALAVTRPERRAASTSRTASVRSATGTRGRPPVSP